MGTDIKKPNSQQRHIKKYHLKPECARCERVINLNKLYNAEDMADVYAFTRC